MNPRGTVGLCTAFMLCGCAPEEVEPEPDQGMVLEQSRAEPLRLVEDQPAAAFTYLEQPEDNWVERDGTLVCEGYMTRYADERFCASEVPHDWRAFEFNGQTYYVQPLAQE